MVSAADIRRGRDALVASGAGFALAVSVFPAPVQRAMTEDERGRLRMMLPEYAGTRSQDLPKVFQDAGQFCWGRASAWASSLPVLASDCVPVLILRDRVIDIDTEEDWRTAERMFSALASTQG
jgi:N-acylneuraminate cytidylyltransferase